MIHISEQTITMTVRTAKEIMQKLVTCGLIDSDEATFSLKMSGRQDAEFIVPFPHNLDLIEPHPNNENGH